MTTNNAPIAAWAPSTALQKLESRHNNAPCILTDTPAEFNDVALVRLADYEALQAECEELKRALAESRANDLTAMGYLNQIRGLVGGDDFPDMVRRCEKLRKDAGRYRWLRDGASMLTDLNPWEDVGFVGAVCVCTEYGSQTALTDEDLDAAIDDAMQGAKP